jgi:hypothetical protein
VSWDGYSRAGHVAIGTPASPGLTTTYAVFAVTGLPYHHNIDSIEVLLDTVSGTGLDATVLLTRDLAGVYPLTSDTVAGATQTITDTTGALGGLSFTVGKDHHFDSTYSVAGSATDTAPGVDPAGWPSCTVYVWVKMTNSGTANVTDLFYNYRAGAA